MQVVEELAIYIEFESEQEMNEVTQELSDLVSGMSEDYPFIFDLLSALNEYKDAA